MVKRKKSVKLPLRNAEVISYKTTLFQKYDITKYTPSGKAYCKMCRIEFKDPKWGKVIVVMPTTNEVCYFLKSKSSPGTVISGDFIYTHHFDNDGKDTRIVFGKCKPKMTISDIVVHNHVPWTYDPQVKNKNEKIERYKSITSKINHFGNDEFAQALETLKEACKNA